MVLGDSLVVMNLLLRYEGLGGQAQMIHASFPIISGTLLMSRTLNALPTTAAAFVNEFLC
jgi:hypothetical protein